MKEIDPELTMDQFMYHIRNFRGWTSESPRKLSGWLWSLEFWANSEQANIASAKRFQLLNASEHDISHIEEECLITCSCGLYKKIILGDTFDALQSEHLKEIKHARDWERRMENSKQV